jgi:hypothetical protein
MIFNGHTHETIAALDEMTFAQIQTMYADGVIGNHGLLTTLGNLTTGVFNYMREASAPAYRLPNIMNSAYDYIYPPLTTEQLKEQASNQLLAFMAQAPGYTADKFGVTDG